MKRYLLSAVVIAAALVCLPSKSQAQYVTYYSPVVAPVPAVVYRPVVARPVAYRVARPVVAAPVAVTRTRWRPFLGGTVTRVRYGYAPVYGY